MAGDRPEHRRVAERRLPDRRPVQRRILNTVSPDGMTTSLGLGMGGRAESGHRGADRRSVGGSRCRRTRARGGSATPTARWAGGRHPHHEAIHESQRGSDTGGCCCRVGCWGVSRERLVFNVDRPAPAASLAGSLWHFPMLGVLPGHRDRTRALQRVGSAVLPGGGASPRRHCMVRRSPGPPAG